MKINFCFRYLDSPISALLVVLFVLFFGSIGVVYVNKTSVGTSLASKDVDFRLCTNSPTQIPDLNCVKEDDKTYMELMIGIILQGNSHLYSRDVEIQSRVKKVIGW